jgi:hypothetical protein
MLRLAEAKTGVRAIGTDPDHGARVIEGNSGTGNGSAARNCSRTDGWNQNQAEPLQTSPVDGGAEFRAQGCGHAKTRLKQSGIGDFAARSSWQNIAPAELAALVSPRFAPGSVAQVTGSMAALWAVAATGMGGEDWAAIAGLPQAGLLAAAQAGLALSRSVVVPSLGDQPVRVLAGLVDAYGLVVAGGLKLAAGDRRRIEARLRFTGGRLVTTSQWGGAKLTVAVKASHGSPLRDGRCLDSQPAIDLELVCKGGFGMWP